MASQIRITNHQAKPTDGIREVEKVTFFGAPQICMIWVMGPYQAHREGAGCFFMYDVPKLVTIFTIFTLKPFGCFCLTSFWMFFFQSASGERVFQMLVFLAFLISTSFCVFADGKKWRKTHTHTDVVQDIASKLQDSCFLANVLCPKSDSAS